ncbi:unnamed protein product [Peniophora sp. CBMAI 1063]|nr:unnamed protein product [Peniophora sp. CBMAI 1063]
MDVNRDVLLEIFEWLAAIVGDRQAILTETHVCHGWRCIVLGEAALWRSTDGELDSCFPVGTARDKAHPCRLRTKLCDIHNGNAIIPEWVRSSEIFTVPGNGLPWYTALTQSSRPWTALLELHFEEFMKQKNEAGQPIVYTLSAHTFPNLTHLSWKGSLPHGLPCLSSVQVTFGYVDDFREAMRRLPPTLRMLDVDLEFDAENGTYSLQELLQPLSGSGLVELHVGTCALKSPRNLEGAPPVVLNELQKLKMDNAFILHAESLRTAKLRVADVRTLTRAIPKSALLESLDVMFTTVVSDVPVPEDGYTVNRGNNPFPRLLALKCQSGFDGNLSQLSQIIAVSQLISTTLTFPLTHVEFDATSPMNWADYEERGILSPWGPCLYRPALIPANNKTWTSFLDHDAMSERDTLVITAREGPGSEDPKIIFSVVGRHELQSDGYAGAELACGMHLHVGKVKSDIAPKVRDIVSPLSAVHAMSLVADSKIRNVHLRCLKSLKKKKLKTSTLPDLPLDPTALGREERDVAQLCSDLRRMLNVEYFMADIDNLGDSEHEEIGFLKALLKSNTEERDTGVDVTMPKLACIAVRVTASHLSGQFWNDLLSLARVRSDLAGAGRCKGMRITISSHWVSKVGNVTFGNDRYLADLGSAANVVIEHI